MLHCHDRSVDCPDVLYIFSVRMSVYHEFFVSYILCATKLFGPNTLKTEFWSKFGQNTLYAIIILSSYMLCTTKLF